MKTALYDSHIALGAKMVPFAGWEMPIQYKGILAEHQAVRNKCGLFDVSHMGRIEIEGPDAEALLDFLSTNTIQGKKEGTATYTVWCHENGGSVDDLLVYKESQDKFFIIVNASNRQKDLEHLQKYAKDRRVKIKDFFNEGAILALQGPKARSILINEIPHAADIKPMHFIHSNKVIISRTGYTGADGFELYANSSEIKIWWNKLIDKGAIPVGLGARDTLRLEMGYALYGHELSDSISPTESVASWAVKIDKHSFVGKEALEQFEMSGKKRMEVGVILLDPGISREGYSVFQENVQIGKVTSGNFSPTLQKAIAIILVNKKLKRGDTVEIQIRDKHCRAEVVDLPFIK